MAQEVLIGEGPSRAKLRNPWGVVGLLLITLGIYGIFWWYSVNREMRDDGQATGYDLGQNPPRSALALFTGALIIVPPSSPAGGAPSGRRSRGDGVSRLAEDRRLRDDDVA